MGAIASGTFLLSTPHRGVCGVSHAAVDATVERERAELYRGEHAYRKEEPLSRFVIALSC